MLEKDIISQFRVSDLDFPANRYDALEECRKLLGLKAHDFSCLLRILCKAELGSLVFDFGSLSVHFCAFEDEGISLTFEFGQKELTKIAGYRFKPSDFGISKKGKRLEDQGGE